MGPPLAARAASLIDRDTSWKGSLNLTFSDSSRRVRIEVSKPRYDDVSYEEFFKNRAAWPAGKRALGGDRGKTWAPDTITAVNPAQPLVWR